MSCLSDYLRKSRENLNLSMDAVYELTGITDSRLHRIESGNNQSPPASVLKLLSDAYHIDLIDLFIRVGYLEQKDVLNFQHDFKGVELLEPDEKSHIQQQIDFLLQRKSQKEV